MQKHVNLVDLVKSFPTNIYLQNLASIQKRTSPVKFAHLAEKSGKGSISNLSTKVFEGETAVQLAARFPAARVHGVDPFRWRAEDLDDAGLAIIDELNAVSDHQYHMTRARFAALPNAVLHRNASAEAAAEFPLASIDLVFIDARHDWPFVAEDLALWAPRVRPGGIVAGHDFSPMFPGVVDAVLEYRAG